jgi:hypothetical protein
MNQLYLGEMFGGAGKAGLQFKSFPYQQVIRDFNTFDMFMKGSGGIWGVGDMTARLIRTQAQIMTDLLRVTAGDKTYKYSPGRQDIDQEARAFLRMIGTRGAASFVAGMTEVGSIIGYIARMATGRQGFGMMRSAENPIFGILIRWLIISMYMANDWDDEDEDKRTREFFDDIARVIFPVFISIWWQLVRERKEMVDEDRIPDLFSMPNPHR